MDPLTGHLGVEILGVAAVNHQTGLAQAAVVDGQGLGKAGHPHHHVGFGERLLQGQDPATAEGLLQIQQALLLPSDQEQFTHACFLAEPAADRAADVTGGADHGDFGLAQVDAQQRGIGLDLLADHPGRVGVACCETLPLEGGVADLLELREVVVLENDRGETAQGCDVDPVLLRQFHGVLNLAGRGLEAAQHLRHEAGVDVGPLDGGPGFAGDLEGLQQLRWSRAPGEEVRFGHLL